MAREIRTGQPRVGVRAPQGGGRVSSTVASAVGGPRVSQVQYNPQFGARALANALEGLSGTLGTVVNAEMREQAKKAERVSAEAGARWGLVGDIADLNLPTGDSIGEEAFRRSAIQAASANVELRAREEVDKLAQQFPGKPEAFRKALEERTPALLEGIDPSLAVGAANAISTLGQRYYVQADEDRRAYIKDQTRAAMVELSDAKVKSAAILARRGDLDGAMAEVHGLAETLADAGPVAGGGSGAFSLTDLSEIQIKAKDKIRGDFLEGWVARTPNKRAALDGLRKGKTGDAAVDGVLAVSDPDSLDPFLSKLESDIRAEEAEARQRANEVRQERRFWAQQTFDDAMAAAERGETLDSGVERTLVEAYGDRAAPMINSLRRVRETAGVAAEFGTMTVADMDAAIAAAGPGGENYKVEANTQDAMIAARARVLKARREDPAAAVATAFSSVAVGLRSDDPAVVGQALRQSWDIQGEVFGLAVGERKLLTPGLKDRLITNFKNAPTADERISILQPYTTGLRDDEMGSQILSELEGGGLSADARLAMERYGKGDLAGAREIMAGATTKRDDFPKLDAEKEAAITAAVTSRMADPSKSAGLTTWRANLSRQPGLFQRAAGERDTFLRMTRQYVAAGEDPETAADHAMKAIYGDGTVIGDDDLGYVEAPADVDPDEFLKGLEVARGVVDLSKYAPPPLGPDATGEQIQQHDFAARDYERWVESIRSGGLWTDVEGGYALLDPTTGRQAYFLSYEAMQAIVSGDLRGGAGNDRLEGVVSATGGGINPQIGVLLERIVGSRPAPVYDPPGLTAESVRALGIPTAPRREPSQVEGDS